MEDVFFSSRTPSVGFSFAAYIFIGGLIPNPLDIRFKKISGISQKISTETLQEGGQNLFSHRFPNRIEHENLVLERGIVTPKLFSSKPADKIPSPITAEFNLAMSTLTLVPSNILVVLLDNSDDSGLAYVPTAAWLFFKTYPVSWKVGDLDADTNSILLETMEFSFESFFSLRL